MNDIKDLQFTKKPSALYTVWQAFTARKNAWMPKQKMPLIRVKRTGLKIATKHIRQFYEISEIPLHERLHILYPFALAYPYMMRILCSKGMPFSMFKILNTRNRIHMYRHIKPDEVLDLECRNSEMRIVSKGLEVDIVSEFTSNGEKVWDNTTTYFVRSKLNDVNPAPVPLKLDPIVNEQTIDEWYLPARDRFRFAMISGDTNGIHYGAFYARMQGFKRDFAQPIRVIAHSISSLPCPAREGPARLDFFLKGPVYYERTLVLKNQEITGGCRFNLYIKGEDKPCVEGKLVILGTAPSVYQSCANAT